MDNVTHLLCGFLVAEAVVQAVARGEPRAAFRRRAWTVSGLTNNLPDFDFLYQGISGGKLGYLLHHRGHTHTLAVGLLLGLLTYAAARLLERRSREPSTGAERRALLGLALGGPCLHIGLDFSNNYGVHPFWPLYSGWFYGDTIFIVEPWFFVVTLPPLLLVAKRVLPRVLLALALVTALVLVWAVPLVGPGTAAVVSLGTAGWFWLSTRIRPDRRAAVALALALTVSSTFFIGNRAARALASRHGLDPEPGGDVVLTPAPANPLCWTAIAISRRGTRYDARIATLAIAPGVVPARACRFAPSGLSLPPSARRRAPEDQGGADYREEVAWSAPLAELVGLYRNNCEAAAFLRFSRVPFWVFGAERIALGDLRYDRDASADFAEIDVAARPSECPRWVPPWRPPRHELLEPR